MVATQRLKLKWGLCLTGFVIIISIALLWSREHSKKNKPGLSATDTKRWKELYQTANTMYHLPRSAMSNYDKNETSPDYIFHGTRSRLNVKTIGANPLLTIVLLKKGDEEKYAEEKRIEINKKGDADYDLGLLDGNYYLGVIYNSTQSVFRVAWEVEGE